MTPGQVVLYSPCGGKEASFIEPASLNFEKTNTGGSSFWLSVGNVQDF